MGSKKLPKILLADDSETFLRAAKFLLRDYEIETAVDGEEALEKIKANPPDIFFVDLVLPKISGTDLISQVTREYPNITIIALTAIDDDETVQEVLQMGAKDYLIKGALSSETFKTIIDKFIDSSG
ncbi:MAG: response regulator transcription factor [Candidatus Odinarchaeota archaeon]